MPAWGEADPGVGSEALRLALPWLKEQVTLTWLGEDRTEAYHAEVERAPGGELCQFLLSQSPMALRRDTAQFFFTAYRCYFTLWLQLDVIKNTVVMIHRALEKTLAARGVAAAVVAALRADADLLEVARPHRHKELPVAAWRDCARIASICMGKLLAEGAFGEICARSTAPRLACCARALADEAGAARRDGVDLWVGRQMRVRRLPRAITEWQRLPPPSPPVLLRDSREPASPPRPPVRPLLSRVQIDTPPARAP